MIKVQKNSRRQMLGICIVILFLLINCSPNVQELRGTPSEIKLFEGDMKTLNFRLPFSVKVESDEIDVLKINGNSLSNDYIYNIGRPFHIESVRRGNVFLNFRLFGFIPLKELKISVKPQRELLLGGDSVGVTIDTQGALVVGISDVLDETNTLHCPAADAGLRPGDIIDKINGVQIKNADHLSILIEKLADKEIELEVRRDDQILTLGIIPIKTGDDDIFRLGIWVRDSTAGVGTLTFVDPRNKMFGALGHPITDIDTGSLLSVKDGEIIQAKIIDIIQGERGKPGEIKGIFSENQNTIGSIIKNTQFGIYGKIYDNRFEDWDGSTMPICRQEDVKLGPASILSTVNQGQPEEYSINIIKTNKQSTPGAKGMVIEITDPRLLMQTGGIVQGMSGSPIIQEGKIVGAITHVFVNNPRKGYGIFIEWMLNEVDKIVE
ncbi:MAG: SpoIVB peptidase [Clostridiales bacterium]|nr:SpoIVB peptidase [Clostridiales bacterium]